MRLRHVSLFEGKFAWLTENVVKLVWISRLQSLCESVLMVQKFTHPTLHATCILSPNRHVDKDKNLKYRVHYKTFKNSEQAVLLLKQTWAHLSDHIRGATRVKIKIKNRQIIFSHTPVLHESFIYHNLQKLKIIFKKNSIPCFSLKFFVCFLFSSEHTDVLDDFCVWKLTAFSGFG